MNWSISLYRDRRELWPAACALIRGISKECIEDHGYFTLVLAGGKTPEELYNRLAEDEVPLKSVPWDKVFVFWGDERFVPHDHPDSNYAMARRTLLSKIKILDENVFPIPTDAETPERAAALYEEKVKEAFQPLRGGAVHSFDLVLLGMGKDGHTASLYPGSNALEEKSRWFLAVEAPAGAPVKHRITMTLPLINNARNALFIVTGDDKRQTLRKALAGAAEDGHAQKDPVMAGALIPAQLVRPRNTLSWFTDTSLWQI